MIERIALILGIVTIGVARYTANIAKNNQTRNERYLTYQFKLGELDSEGKQILEKLKGVKDLNGIYDVDVTNPLNPSYEDLLSLYNNKSEYERVYEKMKNEFNLKDI